jgi:hypothetical protein
LSAIIYHFFFMCSSVFFVFFFFNAAHAALPIRYNPTPSSRLPNVCMCVLKVLLTRKKKLSSEELTSGLDEERRPRIYIRTQ